MFESDTVVFSYSRKQAIEDGVLVDLTIPGFRQILARHGVKVHAAMTATCYAAVITNEPNPQSVGEILNRAEFVMMRFRQAVMNAHDAERVDFVIEGVDGEDVAMYAHIGPGDEGEPVLTFMLEGED